MSFWLRCQIIILTSILLSTRAVKQIHMYQMPLVSSDGYDEDWNHFKESIRDPELVRISFGNIAINKDGLARLFGEDLQHITQLHFTSVNFNQETIQYLLNQSRLYQFDSLVFSDCNLFCQDFEQLEVRQTNITKLTLEKNPISTQGFKYLSRLKMNLTVLELAESSLIDDEAVDAVISLGLSNIQGLDLCATSISDDNLLRVLKEVNLTRLANLKICSNNFPVSFYSEFSKLNLTSLEHLNLNDLNIDEEGFEALDKMMLPSLKSIVIERNQLTTESAYRFFNRQRFPKLSSISIDGNFLNATFLQHLKKEGFVLKLLSCQINKMNLNGLTYISELDTSKLAVLDYGARSTTPEIMKNFITDTDFSSLTSLTLNPMKNSGDYFKYILSRKWPNLQSLKVYDVYEIDASIYNSPQPTFPNLTSLSISFETMNQQTILSLIKNMQRIAPKLASIILNAEIVPGTINAVINGSLAHSITTDLLVVINHQFPYHVTFGFKLHPTKMCKITSISLPNTFMNSLFAKGESLISLSQITEATIRDFLDMLAQIASFQNNLHRNLDFSQLVVLQESDQLNFIKKLLGNNQGRYVFKYLTKLQLQVDQNTPLALLKNCSFPGLLDLTLKTERSDEVEDIDLSPLYGKFSTLTVFNTDLWMDKTELKQFFKGNKLTNLEILNVIKVRNLKPEDLAQIHSSLPYLSRVRQFQYDQAFINNDLTFLTKTGIKPVKLVFGNILFKANVIQQLCDLDFEFLIEIVMINVGADDKSITELINCMENKVYFGKKRDVHFPKLKGLSMEKNYIGAEGIQRIMGMKLPLLEVVSLDNNVDSEIFNSVFRSPWSRRVNKFVSQQKKSGSIDPNIDPRNTRKLSTLQIKNANLLDSDILTLSNMQFYSLESLTLGIYRIENCEFLKNLLKLTKNVIEITISIKDSPKINSKCLTEEGKEVSWVEPELLALEDDSYYGEISNFAISLVGKTSEWKSLVMKNSHMPESTATALFQTSDFTHINTISFVSCGLSDKLIEKLAQQNLQNIKEIHLDSNPLTGKAMEYLFSRNLSKLTHLTLSRTNIGDEGIEHLIKYKYESLMALELANVGLTREGILMLNQLQAPSLSALDISNNGLSFEDLLELQPEGYQLDQLIVYPSLRAKQAERLQDNLHTREGIISFRAPKVYSTIIAEENYKVDEVEYYRDEEKEEDVQ